MGEFVAWLESPQAKALHPLEYSAPAHYQFVTSHPFRDGNGRDARLLMNLLLLRAGYPITVLTHERRAEYTESLAEACRESFDEYFRLLATAGESRGRGAVFYSAMLKEAKENS